MNYINDIAQLDEAGVPGWLQAVNAAQADFPAHKCIHELFEEQVMRTPAATAVEYEGQSLTYAELNSKANQLARYLRGRGVGPDQLVALHVERGFEMLIGMLGILKAGGAYVPLDPGNPVERLRYMLENAAPRVLLTQEKLKSALLPMAREIVALDSGWGAVAKCDTENLDPCSLHLNSGHLAYVIYTSGSTGHPKGVMVTHRNVANLVHWACPALELEAGMRCSSVAAVGFDATVFEIWPALSVGATLVLASPRTASPDELLDWWARQPLDVSFLPTPLAEFAFSRNIVNPKLRTLLVGGDRLRFHPASQTFRLINNYGPTETTVVATSGQLEDGELHIGHPISNTQIHILDPQLQPVPTGVEGEIYIGGEGVARGYLNQPELTAQSFIADPFSADSRARMYKTGDLGRWRADGEIDYLGRNDHQVKIRGFRIELGEIEAQLARHAQVREAVVLVREEGDHQRLVAYVVAQGVDELHAHLKSVLPDYMVPSAFVRVERMPLTANGKLDRRALLALELEADASREYQAPQGELEEILAGIWQSLLRVERVGRQDNFFKLGGHSLLIVQVLDRLRQAGLSVEVRRVFESSTLEELARALSRDAGGEVEPPASLISLEKAHLERIARAVPGGAQNIQDIYPLAPLQEGILFHHQLSEQAGDAYVVPMLLCLSSQQKLQDFIRALQEVMDRHDVLRTAVLWEQLPQPVQVVYRHAELPVERITLDPRDAIEQLEERMRSDQQRLDLRRAPLMRLQIAADSSERWYALLQVHHIVLDAVSLRIVLSEVLAHIDGRAHELPATLPYRSHVAQALAQARSRDADAFFRRKLSDVNEPTAPFGLLDVHGDGSQIKEAREDLAPALAQRLRALARRLGVSAATLFHAAWGLVVARTSARDDVVFGSVLLGRLRGSAGAQRILGMFINTLPLRLRLRDVTVNGLVEQTQRELAELLGHEQASLAEAQRCSGIKGSLPLFCALLNYRHHDSDAESGWSGTGDVQLLIGPERTNYPIAMSVDDLGEGFVLKAHTVPGIDPQRLTAYLHTAVQSLVMALEQAPQTPALALSVLPESERRQVIEQFNATRAPYPQQRSIHGIFEETVARTPDAVAVVYGEQSLTYAELNGKANQVAHYLIRQGVQAGEHIPILMPRGVEMLIAQLAVLKCGAVYVPLDPALPTERRAFMIRDCGAVRVLADLAESADEIRGMPRENLGPQSTQSAYVMYTSGSTGVPKGVVVAHRAVLRLVINNGYAQIAPGDAIAHCSNPAFDASTFEIWGALLNGARVVIVSHPDALDSRRFAQLLEREDITILFLTTALFNQHAMAFPGMFAGLRYLLFGGEICDVSVVREVLEHAPPLQLLHVYGPTETTTFATWHRTVSVAEDTKSIPIGRPISNTQVYILDSHRQPVPVGAVGEIYIGGAGVALGYLNRAELTAQRFIADPFSDEPGARMYRSGDLGRWSADGNIDFLGRNDHQIKIRGFRIELGEIETQLARHPQVREAVVIARADVPGETRLVAYFTGRDETGPDAGALRAHLGALLPAYMVPGTFVRLGAIPLTPNGKVDRRGLEQLNVQRESSEAYVAPRNETETELILIWAQLLNIEAGKIGVHDNFFELGGHSLLATQMISKMRSQLGIEVPLKDIFNANTIERVAEAVIAIRHQRAWAFAEPETAELELEDGSL